MHLQGFPVVFGEQYRCVSNAGIKQNALHKSEARDLSPASSRWEVR